MIVDDEPANLRLLERLFRHDYQVITAESGAEALALLEQHEVALLVTDQRMPGMTGIELLKHTAVMRPNTVRIILTGYTDTQALVEAINCGQIYRFITKPWNNDDLRSTVVRALEHYKESRHRFELARTNERLAHNLREMTHALVRVIGDALEAKDEYAHGHASRTRGYAMSIGRRLGLDEESLKQLSLATFLHDIGRLGTPDALLLKPGTFTDDERKVMQQHSEYGARILSGVPGMEEVAVAVRHHHENFDGTGYPDGLQELQIPQLARIILVADAYDALTCPRPFRPAHSHEEAIDILRQGVGTRFDPEAVDAFCELDRLALIRYCIARADFGRTHIPREAFDAEAATFAELQSEVLANPLLAAKILRLAAEENIENPTPDFDSAPDTTPDTMTPPPDIKAACAHLGIEGLRDVIAACDCVAHGNSEDVTIAAMDSSERDDFRERALRCAIAAQLLAEHTGLIEPAAAYALGLMHDIGLSLLRETFPNEMKIVSGLIEKEQSDAEVEMFGVDHAQVGEWVLERCGVPRAYASLVQTHHDGLRSNAPTALMFHVAACLAHADDAYKLAALDALGSDSLRVLGLNRSVLATIYGRIASVVEEQLMTYSLGNA